MSLRPMPSLKSSVVSRSTGFPPSAAPCAAAEGGDFHSDHPCSELRSSWISRLRLHTAPYSPAVQTYSSGKRAATSDEPLIPFSSLIGRRYLGSFPRPPPPPPQIPRADAELQLVASFGPFQVRCYQEGKRVKFEEEVKGRKLVVLQSKLQNLAIRARPSPLVLQFNPQMSPVAARVQGCTIEADPVPSSGFHRFFRPWKAEDKLHYKGYEGHSPCPRPASGSRQRAARGGGAAANDLSDVPSTSRNFQQPEMQACTNKPEEPVSSWNMGRFRRANLVSSVSPSFDLAWNFGRKRSSYADDNVSYKQKRMATEK